MLKRILTAAVAISLMAAPAYAQKRGAPKEDDPATLLKKRQNEEAERAYQNAMKNTAHTAPAAAPSDPWANARGPNDKK